MIGGDLGMMAIGARSMKIGVRSKNGSHPSWRGGSHNEQPAWQQHMEQQSGPAGPARSAQAALAPPGHIFQMPTLMLGGAQQQDNRRGSLRLGGLGNMQHQMNAVRRGSRKSQLMAFPGAQPAPQYMSLAGDLRQGTHTSWNSGQDAHAAEPLSSIAATIAGQIPQTRGARWGGAKKETNPFLEEDHLKFLLGDDIDSDILMRVLKCLAALRKFFDSIVAPGELFISFYELRNALRLFKAGNLTQEACANLSLHEQTMERNITFERFMDVFLPVALSVPEEVMAKHTPSQRRHPSVPNERERSSVSGGSKRPSVAPSGGGSANSSRRPSHNRRSLVAADGADTRAGSHRQSFSRADLLWSSQDSSSQRPEEGSRRPSRDQSFKRQDDDGQSFKRQASQDEESSRRPSVDYEHGDTDDDIDANDEDKMARKIKRTVTRRLTGRQSSFVLGDTASTAADDYAGSERDQNERPTDYSGRSPSDRDGANSDRSPSHNVAHSGHSTPRMNTHRQSIKRVSLAPVAQTRKRSSMAALLSKFGDD